jgi:hypothetical protein
MNKNGQVIFFTLMIGLVVLVLAMGLAYPVLQSSDDATNYSGDVTGDMATLDCNNESISSFDKGACIVADLNMFYFIGGLIFMVGSIIAAKVLL